MSWNTRVRLFTNVPFSSDYQHSRLFDSKTQQANYFNNLSSTTIAPGRQIKIDEGVVDINRYADVSDHYSYIIIENNSPEHAGEKTYFCFVKEVEYINHKTARIHFEIDVLQTYMFDVTIKNSFVERSHMPRWNSNGTPVKNVAPENVNIGSEYETVKSFKFNRNIDKYFNTLIVATSSSMAKDNPSNNPLKSMTSGVATPLRYYIILIPKETHSGARPVAHWTIKYKDKQLYNKTVNGNSSISDILKMFDAFSDEVYTNKIVGVNYLPFYPFNASVTRTVAGVNEYSDKIVYNITDNYPTGHGSTVVASEVLESNYNVLEISNNVGERLSNVLNVNLNSELKNVLNARGLKESKLMMYPFARAIMYDNLGGSFEIKPQYLNGYIRVDALCSISSSPKVAYVVKDYLGAGDFDNALISNINADVEIVNDHTATYIQGRKNSDLVAKSQSLFGGLTQFAGGIATAGVSSYMGNPMGVSAGAAMSAGGLQNAFFGVNAIQAKLEDVKNIPPSLLSQAGATNLALGYDLMQPRIEIQMLGKENAEIVESYFKMYGVAVNKLMSINLRSRTHYNFIKTIGANITGSVPTKHLEIWRKIFDNGVTFWHTNDILNYTLNNNER